MLKDIVFKGIEYPEPALERERSNVKIFCGPLLHPSCEGQLECTQMHSKLFMTSFQHTGLTGLLGPKQK